MKILIIGGTGFIGSSIAHELSENIENDITICDNLFRGKLDASIKLLLKRENVRFINADFTQPSSFELLSKDYDYVYMLASVVGVKYTEEIPDELIRINTSLIYNTLEWMKHSSNGKIVFASTSECYAGTVDEFNYKVPTDERVPLCIPDVRNPRFTYAITKMLGESGFYHYAEVHGFNSTIVRYHNVYGPRMGFKHVIPQVVSRFLNGEENFKIFGHDQTRSFNFISDAVSGTISAMESNAANGEIIHIGDMRSEITIEELVRYIGSLLDYRGDYSFVPAPIGSVSRRCPDTTLAHELFQYSPRVSWKNGVRKTVDWYRNYIEAGGIIYE